MIQCWETHLCDTFKLFRLRMHSAD